MKGLTIGKDVDFDKLVEMTKGYSGADISNVCREAALMPMRWKLDETGFDIQDLPHMQHELDVPVKMEDFLDALWNIKCSVSNTNLEQYKVWMSDFGSK